MRRAVAALLMVLSTGCGSEVPETSASARSAASTAVAPTAAPFLSRVPVGTWVLARWRANAANAPAPTLGLPFEACRVAPDAVTEIRLAFASVDAYVAEVDGKVTEAEVACVVGPNVPIERVDADTLRMGRLGPVTAPASLVGALTGVTGGTLVAAFESGPRKGTMRAGATDVEIVLDLPAGEADAAKAWWDRASKPGLPLAATVATNGDQLHARIDVSSDPVAAALALRRDVLEAFSMPSGSMTPSLSIGENILVDKTDRTPGYGDVIVFEYPNNPQQLFVKRVGALPGDTIEVVGHRLVINGWIAPRCHVGPFREAEFFGDLYVEYLGSRAYFVAGAPEVPCSPNAPCKGGAACIEGACGETTGAFLVPKNEVFVLGDNRDNSHDSRNWNEGRAGGLAFERIVGKPLVVYFDVSSHPRGRWLAPVQGDPTLPVSFASLQGSLTKCLASRPSVKDATPPPPKR